MLGNEESSATKGVSPEITSRLNKIQAIRYPALNFCGMRLLWISDKNSPPVPAIWGREGNIHAIKISHEVKYHK
jgi:hypothetical protein